MLDIFLHSHHAALSMLFQHLKPVCGFQEVQQQLAASSSSKDALEETVNGQKAEVSQLTEDLASVTSDKETVEAMLNQIRAEAKQRGNDLSKIKSGI